MGEKGEEYLFKVVLLGDSAVGKSSLLARYTCGEFHLHSKATIGVEFQVASLRMPDGRDVRIQIWDTAGQERFRAITSAYYRGAAGALVVYDISSRCTFDNISQWLDELKMHSDANLITMLVGNKCDLTQRRQVSMEEGAALAQAEHMFFMETSALDATNVQNAFQAVVVEIYNSVRRKALSSSSNSSDHSLAMRLSSSSRLCPPENEDGQKISSPCCS